MNNYYTLINVIGWIFIYLIVFVDYTFPSENKTTREYRLNSNSFKKAFSFEKGRNPHNKTERQALLREFVLGDFSSNSDDTTHEKEKSYAEISNETNIVVRTNQKDDTNSEATTKMLTNNEINKQKTNSKLTKSIKTRLKNKRNEEEKVLHRKSKYHYKRKRKNYHSRNHPLKENIFSINLGKRKRINQFRPDTIKSFLKPKKTEISKSGFPFEYYDNLALGYSLEDNYDSYFPLDENYYDSNVPYDISDGSWRKNDYRKANEIRFKEPKTLQNLNQKSYQTIKISTQNLEKKSRTGHVITTKQVQQKSKLNKNTGTKTPGNELGKGFLNKDSILMSDRKKIIDDNNNNSKHTKRFKNEHLTKTYQNVDATNYKNKSSIKCHGNCSITRSSKKRRAQVKTLCNKNEKALKNSRCKYDDNGSRINSDTHQWNVGKRAKNQRKFYTLLKNATEKHRIKNLEANTLSAGQKGDFTSHNSNLHSKNRKEELAMKPEHFAKEWSTKKGNKSKQNSTIKNNTLFQQMLNIPLKLIVNFFRKYIFGNEDPGDLLLKDIWQLPNHTAVSKTKLKIKVVNRNRNQTKTKTKTDVKVSERSNLKAMFENKHKPKKSTRRLEAKLAKEANAVARTFSSNKHSTLKGNDASIELIDVLIDGRFLDKNKYLNNVYKKSFLPKLKDNYFPEKRIFLNPEALNNKKNSQTNSKPYYIPLKPSPGINVDGKNKENPLLEKASSEFNVKRTEISYPEISAGSSQFHSNYQNFYDNRQISSFKYPWNIGENYGETRKDGLPPEYTIPQRTQRGSYHHLNTGEVKQKQYYGQYLTLQETAHQPPPFMFNIYKGDNLPNVLPWNKLRPMKDKRKHGLKYKGIFGNKDDDLQSSCTNLGKQDYIDFCPKGWVSFKQFCFSLDEETHGWSEIPDICSRKNGKMAMPKSQEVIGFLVDQLSSKKQYTKAFFVGLRKIDEEWKWIDDTPLSEGLSDQIESDFHSCAVIQEGSLRKMPCDFKAGYICEMKTGIEASRVLTFGDSLTKGYFDGGKSFHPYGAKLEVLLNKDDHRCFALDVSGKNGEQSDHMLQRLTDYLNMKQRIYNWVLIMAGTNDLLMSDDPSDKIADQIVIMHEVVHARGAKSLVITIPEIFCERTNCKNVKQRRQTINKRLRTYAAANGSKAYLCDLALRISLHQLSLEDRKAYWEPSGIHLKPKGYDKMAEIIFKDLMESIESPFAK